MAMSGSGLGAEIAAKLSLTDADAKAEWAKVADAIVAHIQTHAVVANTGTATGVTVGAAAAPVTSTGSIS